MYNNIYLCIYIILYIWNVHTDQCTDIYILVGRALERKKDGRESMKTCMVFHSYRNNIIKIIIMKIIYIYMCMFPNECESKCSQMTYIFQFYFL